MTAREIDHNSLHLQQIAYARSQLAIKHSRLPLYDRIASIGARSWFGDWLASCKGSLCWAYVETLADEKWPLWYIQTAVRILALNGLPDTRSVTNVLVSLMDQTDPSCATSATWVLDWWWRRQSDEEERKRVARVLFFRRGNQYPSWQWDRMDRTWAAAQFDLDDLVRLLEVDEPDGRVRWLLDKMWPVLLSRGRLTLKTLKLLARHRHGAKLRSWALSGIRLHMCLTCLLDASPDIHPQNVNWIEDELDALYTQVHRALLAHLPLPRVLVPMVAQYLCARTLRDFGSHAETGECTLDDASLGDSDDG